MCNYEFFSDKSLVWQGLESGHIAWQSDSLHHSAIAEEMDEVIKRISIITQYIRNTDEVCPNILEINHIHSKGFRDMGTAPKILENTALAFIL